MSLCSHQLLGAAAEPNWERWWSKCVGSLPPWQVAQMLFNILCVCIALINSWGTLMLIRSAWQSWLEQRQNQNLSLIHKLPTQGWKCQTSLYWERGEWSYEEECHRNILHFQLLLWLCPSQHHLLLTHYLQQNHQMIKKQQLFSTKAVSLGLKPHPLTCHGTKVWEEKTPYAGKSSLGSRGDDGWFDTPMVGASRPRSKETCHESGLISSPLTTPPLCSATDSILNISAIKVG